MPLTPTLQYTRLVTPPQTGGSMTRLAIPYLWDGSTMLIAYAWDRSTNEVHWLHYTDVRSVFALLGGDPLLLRSHIFQYSSVDQEGGVSCWLFVLTSSHATHKAQVHSSVLPSTLNGQQSSICITDIRIIIMGLKNNSTGQQSSI